MFQPASVKVLASTVAEGVEVCNKRMLNDIWSASSRIDADQLKAISHIQLFKGLVCQSLATTFADSWIADVRSCIESRRLLGR